MKFGRHFGVTIRDCGRICLGGKRGQLGERALGLGGEVGGGRVFGVNAGGEVGGRGRMGANNEIIIVDIYMSQLKMEMGIKGARIGRGGSEGVG